MAASEAAVPATPSAPPAPINVKSGFKSWRKKYRKMKLKFDEQMKESNDLFVDQHKALALAKRLQEQNDQLLDLLLELNEGARGPAHMCYELDTLPLDTPSLKREEARIEDTKPSKLAAQLSANGEASSEPTEPHARSLKELLSTPHTAFSQSDIPEDLLAEPHAGYLSPTHEDEYLSTLDVNLADGTDLHRRTSRSARVTRASTNAGTSTLSEKDVVIQNPNSVYNWLRRNQPHVFIQERERDQEIAASEKQGAAPKPSSSSRASGKRASAAAAAAAAATHPKSEQDLLDDDIGFLPDVGISHSKGKRTRDDEPYRPKGGSSRPSKRKREDGEKGSGKKKAKTSNVGPEKANGTGVADGESTVNAAADGG